MDSYGSLTVSQEDADLIYHELRGSAAVVFALASGDGGALICCVTVQFNKIGVMPFGGNPVGRAYVGLYGRGCNHLGMHEIHWGYIAEKLKLPEVEAKSFADFWNMVWKGRERP